MIGKMPTYGFAWEKNVDDFTPEKINQLVKKARYGYILEVDLEYLKQLKHKKHNKQPFLAKRMKTGKVEKPLPNLNNKKIGGMQ